MMATTAVQTSEQSKEQLPVESVMVTDIPCSPKKLAFKNEVENNDSESVLENKGRSDSDIKDNCLEVESSAQHSTTNLPQRVSHSVSTGEVKLTPYKIAAVCAICFIIGCFTLPIIFYYVNDGERIDTEECSLSKLDDSNSCSEDVVHLYEALRATNLSNSSCINSTKDLFCDNLDICRNSSNVNYIICRVVRVEYCSEEWMMLKVEETEKFNCDEFVQLKCSDQFGNNGSVCLPLCEKFSYFGETFTTAYIVLNGISNGVNIIGGIVVIIVSIRKRKKMFLFPQVLIVVNAVIMTIVSFFLFIVVLSVSTKNLLCGKKFLAKENLASPFCQVQGFILTSGVTLYCMFLLVYVFHLSLRLLYPVKSRQLDQSEYSRKIHIVEFMCVFIVGTVPYLVLAATSKFQITVFPPLRCGVTAAYNFYGVIVPTIFLGCTSLILMLIVLYKIHIHQGIFKKRSIRKVCTFELNAPEIKIFLILCYLLAIMVIAWTTFSLVASNSDELMYHTDRYVACMAHGDNKECSRYKKEIEDLFHPSLHLIYTVMLAFFNFSSLPLVVQFRTVKQSVSVAARRMTRRFTISS
ncbi:uncharacterized protein [Dysidea avara]|uniref:uncharacterized protein isoform X2 n=1 Tax=Dysidea avara TaxID=196820 RepID=UPI00333129F8